ncbi:hypothetical protein MKEN_00873900 [Mycena kentingensis (nom. inval.)]|nr:hypothetical protein MKEN_00873900 [Mycena kentingensis (nom. inval.)]
MYDPEGVKIGIGAGNHTYVRAHPRRPTSLPRTASSSSSVLPLSMSRRLVSAVAFCALGVLMGLVLASGTSGGWMDLRGGGAGGGMETCVAHFTSGGAENLKAGVVTERWTRTETRTETRTVHAVPTGTPSGEMDLTALVNGPPSAAFKDNLREGVQYITGWPGSGWTNDVILFMNLLYLAKITDRVAVLTYFTPTHIGGNAPTINFGEVYDVPRLERAMGMRILEWHQVKDPKSEVVDTMGCWSVWKAVQTFNTEPHFTSATTRLKLDVSYTTAPRFIKVLPEHDSDPHASFWSLASLAFPETRAANLQPPTLSPIHQVALPPDEQMLCFDYLYYVGASNTYEWEADYSPAWRFAGQYMHWTEKLINLAERYVREALVVAPYTPDTPPYIAVHVRHGDFAGWCQVPLKECFAPLSAFARRVDEVQEEIWEKKKIVVDRVIVTSDEQDPVWWEAVNDLGWVRPDHSETAAIHGAWYPILIDAAIQSGAAGFVGTDRSTVSIMAKRRVESWNNGPTRMVRWGHRRCRQSLVHFSTFVYLRTFTVVEFRTRP